jgi:mRNA interferase RelE/StbE
MADYSIILARSARKELEKLPPLVAHRIIEDIEALAQKARPPRAIKLHGNKDLWRLRVGDYRVIYRIDDPAHVIDIAAVRHRRDVYRDL